MTALLRFLSLMPDSPALILPLPLQMYFLRFVELVCLPILSLLQLLDSFRFLYCHHRPQYYRRFTEQE